MIDHCQGLCTSKKSCTVPSPGRLGQRTERCNWRDSNTLLIAPSPQAGSQILRGQFSINGSKAIVAEGGVR